MECPGCGETGVRTLFSAGDRLYHTTDKSFLVVECKTCRLIRLEPRPSPKELADYYPREYWYQPDADTASRIEEAYRRFVLRDHVNFVMRAIEDSGQSGLVVDVGCGGGLFLKMLRDRGVPVLGLETSHPAAAAAWNQNRVAVVCGDLSKSPIERGGCAIHDCRAVAAGLNAAERRADFRQGFRAFPRAADRRPLPWSTAGRPRHGRLR